MNKILKNIIKADKTDFEIGLGFLLFSILTLNYIFLENNIFIFLVFFFLSIIFIWNSPRASILAIMLSIMIFGEKFSLLPLQIGRQIYKIYVMDILLIIIFFFWFLQEKISERKKISEKKDRKNIWLFLFWIMLIFSLLRSFFLGTDLFLAFGTFKNYSYLLIYFLAIGMFSSWREVFRVLRVLFFGGILIIGFIIFGFLAGKGLWTEGTPGLRYLSGLHAYFLTFSLVIIFVLASCRDFLYNNFFLKFIFIAQLVGLIGSMFRHLWLGILATFFSLWIFIKKEGKINILANIWKLFFLAIFCIFFLIWINSFFGHGIDYENNSFLSSLTNRVETFTQTGYQMESAAGWRMEAWKTASQKFLSSPILGIGLGQKIYLDYDNFLNLVDVRNIHNDILSILVQVGILGFLPFLLFHILLVKNFLNIFRKINNEDERLLMLICVGFGIIAIFGAFFALYISFTGTAIFYWTVMALINIVIKLILENEKYNNHHI